MEKSCAETLRELAEIVRTSGLSAEFVDAERCLPKTKRDEIRTRKIIQKWYGNCGFRRNKDD